MPGNLSLDVARYAELFRFRKPVGFVHCYWLSFPVTPLIAPTPDLYPRLTAAWFDGVVTCGWATVFYSIELPFPIKDDLLCLNWLVEAVVLFKLD